MAGYDNPMVVSYDLGLHDFGAAGDALAIKPPLGYENGRVVDIHVAVTETFTQDTTPGYVRLGTAGDADKYAELPMGVAADTNGYNLRDAGSVNSIIDLVQDSVSQVEVALVAPTGGTPAGIGHVTVAIAWF